MGVALAAFPATAVLPWAVVGSTAIAFGTGISMPVYQLALLDAVPHARGTAASVSTFCMLVLNSLLTALVVPVAATSLLRLALTSLGLLVLGIVLFHVHRHGTRRPVPAVPAPPPSPEVV